MQGFGLVLACFDGLLFVFTHIFIYILYFHCNCHPHTVVSLKIKLNCLSTPLIHTAFVSRACLWEQQSKNEPPLQSLMCPSPAALAATGWGWVCFSLLLSSVTLHNPCHCIFKKISSQ